MEGEDLRRWKAAKKEQEQQAAAEEAFATLQKRRTNITDELAAGSDIDETETEPEDEEEVLGKRTLIGDPKKEDLLLVEDIHSAQMLKEIYWSDYKNDWYLDLQKDVAMRAWAEDPEGASLSILGGITPGFRYQAFPVASGVISSESNINKKNVQASLYPSKIVNSPYGIVLDFGTLYPEHAISETAGMSLSTPQVLQTLLAARRAPFIHKDERPHRFVPKDLKLSIRCQRKHLDFSGLSDGKSLRIFLSKMSPRRTILVGACAEATEFLFNHLALTSPYSSNQDVTVVAPSRNYECVNVTQSQILLPAIISDDLAAACRVIHYSGFELGRMQFLLSPPTQESEGEEVQGQRNVILNKPAETKAERTPSGLLMIGDLKLPHIKKSLSDASLILEFSSGDLVVSLASNNKKIASIRKNDEGSITLEGEVCPEYFKIRQFLYDQLAIISSLP